MSKLEAYYEAPYDDQESEEFAWEVEQLMRTEFNPDNYDRFLMALDDSSEKDQKAVEDILYQPQINFEALGRKLYDMAYTYNESVAKRKVAESY